MVVVLAVKLYWAAVELYEAEVQKNPICCFFQARDYLQKVSPKVHFQSLYSIRLDYQVMWRDPYDPNW